MRRLLRFAFLFFPFFSDALILPLEAQVPNDWHWGNPSPQGNDLRAGASGNGTVVLVGDAGAIVSSSDGTNWLPQSSHVLNNLLASTFGNGVFVAVGKNGSIASSADGTSWSSNNSGSTNTLYSVVFGSGLFVAVGQSGTLLSSTNGIKWASQSSGTAQNLRAISYGNARFIAIGDVGPSAATVLSSTNGTDWVAEPFPFRQSLVSAAYKDPTFLVLTSSGVLYSTTNGANWVSVGSGFQSVTGLGGSPNYFAMVDNFGGVYFSTNGQNWAAHYLSPDYWFNAIVYGGTDFIATGTNGIILTSNDTTNWTLRETGNRSALMGVVYAKNQFVAVGKNGAIQTSTNGSAWLLQASGTTNDILSVGYGNGTFAAIGANELVLLSQDGVHWTNRASGTAWGEAIAYGNGVFVASFGGNLFSSPDALNWSPRTNIVAQSVGFGGGQFVACAPNTKIYTSTDGITWALQNAPRILLDTWTIAYGNGLYALAGYPGSSIMTSPDGVNWTNQPSHFNGLSIPGMVFANGLFIAAADGGTMITSTNGVDWVPQQTPASKALYGVAYGNGSYAFVGENGTILQGLSVGAGVPVLTGTFTPPMGILLSLTGQSGRTYRIQASGGLAPVSWQDLVVLTNTGQPMTFEDPAVTNTSHRFYRAVSP